MNSGANIWLIAAGWGSVAAALLHIACMIGGPAWFRFLGAGEAIARAVERGRIEPYVITLAIAAVLSGWAAYAFSGAGAIVRLPLLRIGLLAISAVCLLRAAAVFAPQVWRPEHGEMFRFVSSTVVGFLGLLFLVGTVTARRALSVRS